MRRRVAALATIGAVAVVTAGCGKQSPLDPQGGPARDVATLWWWLFAVASLFFLGTVFLLLMSWVLRRREGIPLLGNSATLTTGLVVAFGMAVPAVVLIAVFVVSDLVVIDKTEAPKAATTTMTVNVIGHQWWWEVRYGNTTAITANEIHIPVKTRVNLVGTTADVIHSFWAPQLNRKIDLVPGRTNRILLYADRPGRYRGECAEFCGLQHAHMSTYVLADPPDRFKAWLAQQERPAQAPTTAVARQGQQVFLSNQCASCHTIRGTPARGQVGPDLTHLQTRSTLGALTIPNTKPYLDAWIRNPQHFKPGNKMPALDIPGPDFQRVLAYLESLH
jgi:cytochrome c oxidase subunit II